MLVHCSVGPVQGPWPRRPQGPVDMTLILTSAGLLDYRWWIFQARGVSGLAKTAEQLWEARGNL